MKKLLFLCIILCYLTFSMAIKTHLRVSGTPILGGYKQQNFDKNDPELQQVVNAGMQHMEQNGVLPGNWKVKVIKSVATQVVAGENYKIDAVFIQLGTNQKYAPTKEVEFIVYRSLSGQYQLTSSKVLSSSG